MWIWRCLFSNKNSILIYYWIKKVIKNMHSQMYSWLSLIFTILGNVTLAGANGFISARWANIVFFYLIGQKKVTLGPIFRSKYLNIEIEPKYIFVNKCKFLLRNIYKFKCIFQSQHICIYIHFYTKFLYQILRFK